MTAMAAAGIGNINTRSCETAMIITSANCCCHCKLHSSPPSGVEKVVELGQRNDR